MKQDLDQLIVMKVGVALVLLALVMQHPLGLDLVLKRLHFLIGTLLMLILLNLEPDVNSTFNRKTQ